MSTLVYLILIFVVLLGLAISIGYILDKLDESDEETDKIYDIILHTNKLLINERTVDEENYILWKAILEIEDVVNKKQRKNHRL
jgi:hypothetical protein